MCHDRLMTTKMADDLHAPSLDGRQAVYDVQSMLRWHVSTHESSIK